MNQLMSNLLHKSCIIWLKKQNSSGLLDLSSSLQNIPSMIPVLKKKKRFEWKTANRGLSTLTVTKLTGSWMTSRVLKVLESPGASLWIQKRRPEFYQIASRQQMIPGGTSAVVGQKQRGRAKSEPRQQPTPARQMPPVQIVTADAAAWHTFAFADWQLTTFPQLQVTSGRVQNNAVGGGEKGVRLGFRHWRGDARWTGLVFVSHQREY